MPPPSAEVARVPIGFSNLVLRIDGEDEIGVARDDHRVQLLERMRERGFHAVGAENLVFSQDESHRAAFQVGGTVREVECRDFIGGLRCRIAVEWQLRDVARDAVVYRVLTRHTVSRVPPSEHKRLPTLLLVGALDAMLGREGFRTSLAMAPPAPPGDPTFTTGSFGQCAPLDQRMPAAADRVLDSTVLIRTRDGFGSGFFLSADGLVLTAAHVVDASVVKLRLRNGTEFDAIPIRVARSLDAAVLRPARPLSGQPCLPVTTRPVSVGAEVYAAGAPADEKLAFSLSRGIVSGLRMIDGRPQLQTDTAVNPGNSGGPLLSQDGEVVAVVTSKLVGRKVEGIAFGAPIAEVLKGLGLLPDRATSSSLLIASSAVSDSPRTPIVPMTDTPDPLVKLERESTRDGDDHDRPESLREADYRQRDIDRMRRDARDKSTPGYVKGMIWGGAATAVVGVIGVAGSYLVYDKSTTTRPEFRSLNRINLASWTLLGLGVGSTLVGLGLRPPLPSLPPSAQATLRIGPGSVAIEGAF